MFGEITFAIPEPASRTPNAPTNCHRDQGSRPPSADKVKMMPVRLTNESAKVRDRPRKARLREVRLCATNSPTRKAGKVRAGRRAQTARRCLGVRTFARIFARLGRAYRPEPT